MNKLSAQIAVTLVAGGCLAAAYAFTQQPADGPAGAGGKPPVSASEQSQSSEPSKAQEGGNAPERSTNPMQPTNPEQSTTQAQSRSQGLPKVSVMIPQVQSHQALVTGLGTATPVQTLSLASEVSGKVVKLSPALKSGQRVRQGDLLLTLDDTQYQEAVASAQSALATAEVTLLQQQLNQTQAKAEWQRSGLNGKPDSALALYEPQVKAAKAAVEYARRTLEKARADLRKTRITAPFNALIISRSVEAGSYVQASSAVAELYGTDQVEIAIPLSSQDWSHLPQMPVNTGWLVTLSDIESQSQWQGYVDRVEQNIDSNTRQRSIILRVDQPLEQTPPLYPGTFTQARIPGKALTSVWQVPASAITRNNEIWLVDASGMLAKTPANVRLRMTDKVYLEPSQAQQVPRIVTRPLASYLPGMKVEAISNNQQVSR